MKECSLKTYSKKQLNTTLEDNQDEYGVFSPPPQPRYKENKKTWMSLRKDTKKKVLSGFQQNMLK